MTSTKALPGFSRRWLCRSLLWSALAGAAAAQKDDATGEFSAHGHNVVRVENEAKLRVPDAIVEDVWKWLQQRYGDCTWLDRDGSKFKATFGDEQFEDVYYDDPKLSNLGTQSGVRVRSRTVMEGSAMRKDGRQLLQFKLNRGDAAGLARTEIKFMIEQNDPRLSLLGMLKPSERDAAHARFTEVGLDPQAMKSVLTIDQNRRRVYVADQFGAIATVTLDMCHCTDFGCDLRWTEIELELNEIRYTEADAAKRDWMSTIQSAIQQDLLAKWPDIVQDQTPKYSKAFAMLEQQSWMPIRKLVTMGLRPGEAVVIVGVIALGIAAVLFLFVHHRRRRARAAAA